MPNPRLEQLKGMIPDELLRALEQEVLFPDPEESIEIFTRRILDQATLAVENAQTALGVEIDSVRAEATEALVSGLEELEARLSDPNADLDSERDAAEAVDAATVGLQTEIDRVATDAASSLADESAVLSGIILANYNALIGDIEAAVASVDCTLQAEINQTAVDAANALTSEVGRLSDLIESNYSDLEDGTLAAVAAAEDALNAKIDQVENGAAVSLNSEADRINSRIGIPVEVTTTDGVATLLATISPTPFKSVRIQAKIQGHREDRLESAAYTIEAFARALPAFGTLTVAPLNPNPGDQIDINGVTYTFQNVFTPTAFEVLIGANPQATIDNLVKAINLTGTAGVEYAAGTTKHPDVSAIRASASTMEAVALTPGVAGNAITTTDPVDTGGNLAWGGGTLAAGSDMTLPYVSDLDDHEDDPAWDASIAINGTNIEIKVTGAALTPIRWLGEVRTIELL